MIGGNKNVFWEALILTVFVFLLGMLFGVAYENSKINEIEQYYKSSELDLNDIFVFNDLIEFKNISCQNLIDRNIEFANKIYEEALLLEKYEDAGKINENMKIEHKKYDLLRTFLWINTIKTREICKEDITTVVYLYEYETENLVQKATQNVWSKILLDLKKEKGNEIILIPIAVNTEIISINALTKKFEINDYPALVINDKTVLTELKNINSIKIHL